MIDTVVYLGHEKFIENSLREKSKTVYFYDDFYYCREKSVKRSEYYQAMATGLKPEKVIVMNRYEFYECCYEAIKKRLRLFARVQDSFFLDYVDYTIIRTYEIDNDDIEIVLSRGIDYVSA